MDELTEFRRDAIEGLRQPLEDGRVVVTRAIGSVEFPARFTLVAAANHFHCDYIHFPLVRHLLCANVTTLQWSVPVSSGSTSDFVSHA